MQSVHSVHDLIGPDQLPDVPQRCVYRYDVPLRRACLATIENPTLMG